jgi:hypothetical protein
MILDLEKMAAAILELKKLDYRKHGVKVMLATGSDLFENKTLMADYLKVEKTSDTERTINEFLEKFDEDFPIVGQDVKDGSKKVGVMLLFPYYYRGKREGYKIYKYTDGIVHLRETGNKSES